MSGGQIKTLYLLNSNDASHFLVLAFVSLFLTSLGMISHNAFADQVVAPNTSPVTTSYLSTNETKIIFHDDYSSSTGWTQIGTEVTVDSAQFPNMAKFNNVVGGGGVTEERVYKQLPSTLPAYDWVLETSYMFTASSIPVAYPVVLTLDSSNPEITSSGTPAPNIRIIHGYDTNQLAIQATGTISPAIPISPNMQYFLRLERTQTQLVLYVFSDPARTHQVLGSPVTMNFNSTALPNLDFIQHSGSRSAGPARTLTGQITNTTIYVTNLPNGTISSVSSPPTGLAATAVSPSQINLSWTAPSSNGGSPVTSYKIYRSISSGTETFLAQIGNVTSYSDSTVTNGRAYFYEVTAVNSAGESAKSNEASATITGPPQSPTGLAATTVSSSQINLSWSTPSNGGSTITGYMIQRSNDSGTTWTTIVANNGCQCDGYLDHSLSPSTTYTYKVSAINSHGTSSPSNIASAATNSAITPPPPTQAGTIFHDGYSSSTGWTQIGTEITVDSPQFPNMVKYNNEAGGGGVDQERMYKQLPSTLPAYDWVLETTYEFTSSSIPSAYPSALTIDSSNPESQPFPTPAQAIWIHHGTGSDVLKVGFVNTESSGIPISPNTPYYLRLERTSSELVLFAFSDPARTVQVPGSPVGLAADSTALENLDFIQHSGSLSSGSARTLTAQVTNTTIYVVPGLTNPTFSPSVPQNLQSTAVSSSQINLSWNAPSSNGGSPITNYKIYRSTSSGTEALLTTIGNRTLYNDTGLTNNTTYFYKVSAVNSVGESSKSNEARATVASTPSAPQSLTAAAVSSSQIYLSWTAPSSNGGSPITGYKIERSADGGATWNATVPNTRSYYTKYMDSSLSGSTTYSYRVSAINSIGTGPASNTATATTNSNVPPPPPNQTGVIFHDDYSSSAGWTKIGTEVTVDSPQFPNMAKFNNVIGGGGTTEERVYKQLPSTLPAYDWVLETTYEFTASSIPVAYPIVLATDSSNPETISSGTPAPNIRIIHGPYTDQLAIQAIGAISPAIPISPNTTYYLKLERTQTSLILRAYLDPARTAQVPGSPVTLSFDPTALHNLNFIQHSGSLSAGSGRTLTGQIADTTIYVRPSITTGAITLNNVQSASGTASTTGTVSSSNQVTIPNFNAGTASNSLLLVGVSANNNSAASVTFRGMPMTSVVSSFYNNDAEFWYLKSPSGTGDIVVTMRGPAQVVVGAYSFSGVNQTDPIPASTAIYNTTPSSPTISITTKYANDLVLDLPSIYGGSTLGSPTCTQQWYANVPNGITGASSSAVIQPPAAVTCKWTASSADLWDDVAVELNAAR